MILMPTSSSEFSVLPLLQFTLRWARVIIPTRLASARNAHICKMYSIDDMLAGSMEDTCLAAPVTWNSCTPPPRGEGHPNFRAHRLDFGRLIRGTGGEIPYTHQLHPDRCGRPSLQPASGYKALARSTITCGDSKAR
ncbi:unnamed protein product [Boreogadus saida]